MVVKAAGWIQAIESKSTAWRTGEEMVIMYRMIESQEPQSRRVPGPGGERPAWRGRPDSRSST